MANSKQKMPVEKKISAFDIALQELYTVAKVMGLSDEVVGYLASPKRVMEVSIPLRMDDGSMNYYKGYRCQHNDALGPTRGGTRLHHAETMDDVKALSFWMTVKNSLAGIPSGGGKGGIAVDPASISQDELQRLCRGYVRAIYPMVNPDKDVFGPDVGTPQSIMAWLLDEYELLSQRHEPTAFSGKPLLLGGSAGRTVSTGNGIVYNTCELLRQTGESIEGKRIAIQGFGNLGGVAAKVFAERGAKVVAITNIFGGAHNPKGMNVDQALNFVAQNRLLSEVEGCDDMPLDDIWGVDCDIILPCALQNAIHEENADLIKAKYIVEGANGPVTPAGEKILLDKGKLVMPGIAANCGGVLVSYFEQVQNRYCFAWPESEVMTRLEETMIKTCTGVYEVAKKRKVSLRVAAWILALDKVVEAMKWRGWVK